MTDNEIIRLLGHIVTLYAKDATTIYGKPVVALLGDALDLINRQNAEIDRLLKAIEDKHCVYEKRVVTEAIKEFWEKAKQTIEFRTQPYVYITDGDNLVKEMVGDAE